MNTKTAAPLAIILALSFLSIPYSADAARGPSRYSESYGMSSSMRRAISDLDDDKVKNLPVPVALDVPLTAVFDNWGDGRSGGRTHEGLDIMAPRGSYIVSPTDAVVTSVVKEDKDNRNTLGGNYVYTQNPGGERFYYAHLDKFADGLKVGKVLKKGDLIGYVGNTGNAAGGATHLHFGIYKDGPTNPFKRVTKEFSVKDKVKIIGNIIDAEDDDGDQEELAAVLLAKYRPLINAAVAAKVSLPDEIKDAIKEEAKAWKTQIPARDLSLNMQGDDVVWLQNFLMSQGKGPAAAALGTTGATGYFGSYTQNAMVEYQAAVGIVPASGVFGPATKAVLMAQ